MRTSSEDLYWAEDLLAEGLSEEAACQQEGYKIENGHAKLKDDLRPLEIMLHAEGSSAHTDVPRSSQRSSHSLKAPMAFAQRYPWRLSVVCEDLLPQ